MTRKFNENEIDNIVSGKLKALFDAGIKADKAEYVPKDRTVTEYSVSDEIDLKKTDSNIKLREDVTKYSFYTLAFVIVVTMGCVIAHGIWNHFLEERVLELLIITMVGDIVGIIMVIATGLFKKD